MFNDLFAALKGRSSTGKALSTQDSAISHGSSGRAKQLGGGVTLSRQSCRAVVGTFWFPERQGFALAGALIIYRMRSHPLFIGR